MLATFASTLELTAFDLSAPASTGATTGAAEDAEAAAGENDGAVIDRQRAIDGVATRKGAASKAPTRTIDPSIVNFS
jgi:hypothetical protein